MQSKSESKAKENWLKHIEGWRESGLSQRGYCQQAGIDNKKFHYHFHRLKSKGSNPGLTFIEAKSVIKSAGTTPPTPKSNVRLILPNGVQVLLEEVVFDVVPQVIELASGLSC